MECGQRQGTAKETREEQPERQEENQERKVFTLSQGKKTELEPAEAKKEGEECRNPLNLAVVLPDRKTMRYNVSAIHFGKYLKD